MKRCCIRYICDMSDFVRKIFAVFLFFLFLEKAALRLIIHTHYHNSTISANFSKQYATNSSKVTSIHCECIDDFFLPLETVEQISLSVPSFILREEKKVFYPSFLSYSFQIILQLRGPPLL